jgi:hypothetical protein
MQYRDENMTSIKQYNEITLYDLEALKDSFFLQNKNGFDYHFNLLKGNLEDLFIKLRVKKWMNMKEKRFLKHYATTGRGILKMTRKTCLKSKELMPRKRASNKYLFRKTGKKISGMQSMRLKNCSISDGTQRTCDS